MVKIQPSADNGPETGGVFYPRSTGVAQAPYHGWTFRTAIAVTLRQYSDTEEGSIFKRPAGQNALK